ncbi:MAG TPA: hypothetical protein VK070_14205 [Acidimicrobiia bacterium]|jgi:hypothetical protein|nr:hypothetical protein [Acidimicrobiia bacterium]
MARRARENRKETPGYEARPPREERKRQHRQVRHAANQLLATVEDPDDLTLPDVRRRRHSEANGHEEPSANRRRFRVWKTKFWKRRDSYRDMKAELDAEWPVVTSHQLENYQI